ncbi:MAG: DUF2680 domain-containing protein [Ignavibacteriaceae bacterium]|nr:DUF2680 domain-containing protein [Ignavibacteriaceae bacterium]
MDPTDTNEISQEFGENAQGEELSHSDKMIGIFTEPTKTFEHTAKFPPRNKDWVIPLVIFFFIVAVIRMVSMMDEEVYFEAKQKQIDSIEKMVESGTLTRDDGDAAIERIDEQMEFMQGPVGWVITIATTLIFGFIVFFIIVGIYFLLVKLLLKGEGSYASALVANGLTSYISIVQYIIVGILTMAFGALINDTSLAALLGSDRGTIAGFLIAKIDPLSLWAYIVLSIGLAKMFKSESTGKYYVLVFSLWIVGGLLLFLVAQAVPFLSFLAQ